MSNVLSNFIQFAYSGAISGDFSATSGHLTPLPVFWRHFRLNKNKIICKDMVFQAHWYIWNGLKAYDRRFKTIFKL